MRGKNYIFVLLAAAALLAGTAIIRETSRRDALLSSLQATVAGNAELSFIPQTRHIAAPKSSSHGTRISVIGTSFLSPWGPATQITKGDENANLQFSREISLSLFRGNAERFLNFFSRHGGDDVAYLRRRLGTSFLQSPLLFYDQILASTPANISPFSWARDIKTELLLLTLKKSLTKEAKGEIWKFSTKTLQGFQIGNPKLQKVVFLYLFTPAQEYDVVVSGASQEEIDTFLSSFTASSTS